MLSFHVKFVRTDRRTDERMKQQTDNGKTICLQSFDVGGIEIKESTFSRQIDWLNSVLHHFQQYFSHITVTAHIIHVYTVAQTHDPWIMSQTLYHWANKESKKWLERKFVSTGYRTHMHWYVHHWDSYWDSHMGTKLEGTWCLIGKII